jgi:hypothetical protein
MIHPKVDHMIGQSTGGIFGYGILDSMTKRIKDLRAGKNDGPFMASFRRNFSTQRGSIISLELIPRLQKSRGELVEGMRADTLRLSQQLRHQRPGRSEPERSAIVQGSDRRWRYP